MLPAPGPTGKQTFESNPSDAPGGWVVRSGLRRIPGASRTGPEPGQRAPGYRAAGAHALMKRQPSPEPLTEKELLRLERGRGSRRECVGVEAPVRSYVQNSNGPAIRKSAAATRRFC